MASLSPIQILMLGLGGTTGFLQGRQQRNQGQLEQQQEAEKLRRLYEQQAFDNRLNMKKFNQEGMLVGPRARLTNAQADVAEAEAGSAKQYATAAPQIQAILATSANPMDAMQKFAAAGIQPPEWLLQAAVESRFKSPVVIGPNQTTDPFSFQNTDYGPLNDKPSAIMREQRLLGGGPEAYFDPEDVAKTYRPQAWKEWQKEMERNPDTTAPFSEYFKGYMEEIKGYGATPTVDPAAGLLGGGGQGGTYESPTLKALGQDPVVALEPGQTPEQAEAAIVEMVKKMQGSSGGGGGATGTSPLGGGEYGIIMDLLRGGNQMQAPDLRLGDRGNTGKGPLMDWMYR